MAPSWFHVLILQSIFLPLMHHVVLSSLSENINMPLKRRKSNCNSLCTHNVCIAKGKDGKQVHCLTYFEVVSVWNTLAPSCSLWSRAAGFFFCIHLQPQRRRLSITVHPDGTRITGKRLRTSDSSGLQSYKTTCKYMNLIHFIFKFVLGKCNA